MDAGIEPVRGGRMKGRAMRRNLMVNAKGLMAAAGVVAACRLLRLPVWSWIDPALMTWARLICLGFGVLVSWNVFCAGKWLGNAWDAQRDRRQAQWVKDMAALYPPPLAQPGNAMQEAAFRMGALQASMAQGMTSMAQTRPGTVRYIPPAGMPTMTGPQAQAPEFSEISWEYTAQGVNLYLRANVGGVTYGMRMLNDGVHFVTPGPRQLSGACAKCGQPMSAHLYYGRGECCYRPLQA